MCKENATHNEEKSQSAKVDTRLTKMSQLADKDIKIIIIILHMF